MKFAINNIMLGFTRYGHIIYYNIIIMGDGNKSVHGDKIKFVCTGPCPLAMRVSAVTV